MKDLITFLKDILMINEAAPISVGLSQFRTPSNIEVEDKEISIKSKDIKLSDLMRRQ